MTISAKVIARSRSPYYMLGVKDITTFLVRYPRFIHAEVMTHRVFSRNASSSRAIPVKRLIQDVLDDTAMPLHWGKNQPGMQAREENDSLILCGENGTEADRYGPYVGPQTAWLYARDRAIEMAQNYDTAGYHKQIVNRLLEPFAHINVVVTSTDFDNFFWLRRHADAQPEIKVLADRMFDAFERAEPELLGDDDWHVPFVTPQDRQRLVVDQGPGKYAATQRLVTQQELALISTARSARTSYMTHDGRVPDFAEDMELARRLIGSEPLHASPAEHQAKPDVPLIETGGWAHNLNGNLCPGWVQYRKTLPRENCTDYAGWMARETDRIDAILN